MTKEKIKNKMPDFLKKLVGRVGDSLGIIFSKKDCSILNIKLGDKIDLSDAIIIKKKENKKEKKK